MVRSGGGRGSRERMEEETPTIPHNPLITLDFKLACIYFCNKYEQVSGERQQCHTEAQCFLLLPGFLLCCNVATQVLYKDSRANGAAHLQHILWLVPWPQPGSDPQSKDLSYNLLIHFS